MNLQERFMKLTGGTAVSLSVALLLVALCEGAFAQKVMPLGSSAMLPTLAKTDEIQINLFAYALSSPARWDVVTYQTPDGKAFFTHRVIGLPGDTITYDRKKLLQINGVFVVLTPVASLAPTENSNEGVFIESLRGERHLVQLREGAPALMEAAVGAFPGREHCTYSQGGFTCVVPSKHYFVMGDNRDSSLDSRYRGFVPEEKIGGRVENVPAIKGKQ
jgi:signal peptidase I